MRSAVMAGTNPLHARRAGARSCAVESPLESWLCASRDYTHRPPPARPMTSTKKSKQPKANKALTPAAPVPTSSPNLKKRKLETDNEDSPASSAAGDEREAADELDDENLDAADGQTLSKAAKGKAKKRRKEEQRALVRPSTWATLHAS